MGPDPLRLKLISSAEAWTAPPRLLVSVAEYPLVASPLLYPRKRSTPYGQKYFVLPDRLCDPRFCFSRKVPRTAERRYSLKQYSILLAARYWPGERYIYGQRLGSQLHGNTIPMRLENNAIIPRWYSCGRVCLEICVIANASATGIASSPRDAVFLPGLS
jgi:hypothetical protein